MITDTERLDFLQDKDGWLIHKRVGDECQKCLVINNEIYVIESGFYLREAIDKAIEGSKTIIKNEG